MFHGILLIDKSEGPTSHGVVSKVRRLLGMKKIGHAGTLDPFATGLLVILLGDATKLARFVSGDDKEYEATCLWGTQTETGDHTGDVVDSCDSPMPPADQVRETMKKFIGEQMQTPPRFSAKKVNGRRMYKLARRGEEIERKPVDISIDSMELISHQKTGFAFGVRCSKGTYIRTLGEDLCRELGGVGHLAALRRISSGPFHIKDAVDLDRLSDLMEKESATEAILPIDSVCERFPAIVINDRAAKALRFGTAPGTDDIDKFDSFKEGDSLRILDAAYQLLALVVARFGEEEIKTTIEGKKAFKIDINFSAKSP